MHGAPLKQGICSFYSSICVSRNNPLKDCSGSFRIIPDNLLHNHVGLLLFNQWIESGHLDGLDLYDGTRSVFLLRRGWMVHSVSCQDVPFRCSAGFCPSPFVSGWSQRAHPLHRCARVLVQKSAQVITASVKSFADCFSSPHGHHSRKPITQGNTKSPRPICYSIAKSGEKKKKKEASISVGICSHAGKTHQQRRIQGRARRKRKRKEEQFKKKTKQEYIKQLGQKKKRSWSKPQLDSIRWQWITKNRLHHTHTHTLTVVSSSSSSSSKDMTHILGNQCWAVLFIVLLDEATQLEK